MKKLICLEIWDTIYYYKLQDIKHFGRTGDLLYVING